jgi:dolichol-phosphate mannosyltransferase
VKIVAVIAAWNERENIEALTRRLHEAFRTMPGVAFEILYVVEGEDGTREIAEGLQTELGSIRILYEAQPHGLGAALRRGFAAVSQDADLVMTMDADLNHQPEEIARLVAALQASNADVVIGSRVVKGSRVTGTPVWKRMLSATLNTMMRAMFGGAVRDKTSGFRVYRAEVLRKVRHQQNDFSCLPEIAIHADDAGYRIIEEPIHFIYRRDGESKMTFWRTSLSYLSLLRTWLQPAVRGRGERNAT